MSKPAALKECAQERCRVVRATDNLAGCLPIEFEIQLGLGSTVVPIGKRFELTPPQPLRREGGASDRDAHARRLPSDPAFLWDFFGRGNYTARDETWSALILTRENEDSVAFGDVLATIHRLVRAERESLRQQIDNVGFDGKWHGVRPYTGRPKLKAKQEALDLLHRYPSEDRQSFRATCYPGCIDPWLRKPLTYLCPDPFRKPYRPVRR